MIIGFLANKIPYKVRRGWGVYSYQLLRAILSVDKENTYKCFYNIFLKGDKNSVLISDNPRLKNFIFPIPGRVMELLCEKWNILSAENFLGHIDILHSPYEFLPKIKKARSVATVHDVTFLKYPEYLDPGFVKLLTRRLNHIKENADRIITVSNNTKKELIALAGVPSERITAIHEGADERFQPIEDKNNVEDVVRRYNITGHYILFVGAADEDKNLVRLSEAFVQLAVEYKDIKLVFAGSSGWGYRQLQEKIKSLHIDNNVIFTGYIPDSDLPALYNGARILAIPSIHEGFGLPALEAMACGTPILCSNISSLPEVVGDAAVQVNPYNVNEIANGMMRLMEDEALRQSCIKKGFMQARKFSWESVAKKVINLYKELIQ